METFFYPPLAVSLLLRSWRLKAGICVFVGAGICVFVGAEICVFVRAGICMFVGAGICVLVLVGMTKCAQQLLLKYK